MKTEPDIHHTKKQPNVAACIFMTSKSLTLFPAVMAVILSLWAPVPGILPVICIIIATFSEDCIRHLVMPNNASGSKEIMAWAAENLSKDASVHIIAQ